MRPVLILVALASVTVGPVMAQGLIAPSRQYNQYKTPEREKLDKSYGLPTFGTPGEATPKQQTMAPLPKQEARPDMFAPLPSLDRPDAPSSADAPDFFQKPSGLAESDTGVPNFFQNTPDASRPKTATTGDGETSTFTTDQDGTTGDTSTRKAKPGDWSGD